MTYLQLALQLLLTELEAAKVGGASVEIIANLQAAIDAARGKPQRFKVRSASNETSRVVDFFSPVPLWAQRRWDAIGEPVPSSGCLFSYKFSTGELPQELEFIQEQLWLRPASQ